MQNALDRGNFEPVGVVSFTTSVIDAPLSSQTFVDVNNNLDTVSVGKKKNVKQRYPDPVATSALVNKGKGDGWQLHISTQASGGPLDFFIGPGEDVLGYQTFLAGESIQQAIKVKAITVVLSKHTEALGFIGSNIGLPPDIFSGNVDIYWKVKARLYRIEGGELTGLNGQAGQSPATVGTDSTDIFDLSQITTFTALTYNFDENLLPGVRYALMVYMNAVATVPSNPLAGLVGGGQPRLVWDAGHKIRLAGIILYHGNPRRGARNSH